MTSKLNVGQADKIISFRCSEELKKAISIVSKEIGMTQTELLQLSIIDFISRLDNDYIYEGLDLKEVLTAQKYKMLRGFVGIQKRELNSAMFIEQRFKKECMNYVLNDKSKDDIKKLLDMYMIYAKYYKDEKALLTMNRIKDNFDQFYINALEYRQNGFFSKDILLVDIEKERGKKKDEPTNKQQA